MCPQSSSGAKCHGRVTFTELSATVPKATTVLPEYTGCSLENPMECAGELCAGNVFWCLLEGVLPGVTLQKRVINVICTLLQDDKSNSRDFHRGNLAAEQLEVMNLALKFSFWGSI